MSDAGAAVTNVVVAGLGGQGVITASDILADAAFRAGFDIKKAEVHGMSQRGGSVSTDVRFGERVYSPMVPAAEADYLVVLAADQVEVHRGRLRPGGVLIAPELLADVPLPNARTLNVALMGALAAHLAIDERCWLEAIRANLKENIREMNERAFLAGRETARRGSAATGRNS